MKNKDELAKIIISINDLGQFVFHITGETEGGKMLAFSIIDFVKKLSYIDPLIRNKFVFAGEELPLLH